MAFKTIKNPKNRTVVIIAIVLIVLGLIIAAFNINKFSSSNPANISTITSVPRGVDTTPGGQSTEKYSKLLQEDNLRKIQDAQSSGKSFVATIGGQTQENNSSLALQAKADLQKVLLADNPDLAALLAKNPQLEEALIKYPDLAKLIKKYPEVGGLFAQNCPGNQSPYEVLAALFAKECPTDNSKYSQPIQDLIKQYPALAKILQQHPELAALLEKYPKLASVLAANPNLAQLLTDNPDLIANLEKNPALVSDVLKNPELLKQLAKNKDREKLANDPDLNRLMKNNPALTSLLNKYPELAALLKTNPELANLLNSNPELAELLAKNPDLLKAVQKDPSLATQLAQNPSLTKKLLNSPKLVAALAKNPALLGVLQKHPELGAVIEQYGDLAGMFVKNPRIAALVAENPSLAAKLAQDPNYAKYLNGEVQMPGTLQTALLAENQQAALMRRQGSVTDAGQLAAMNEATTKAMQQVVTAMEKQAGAAMQNWNTVAAQSYAAGDFSAAVILKENQQKKLDHQAKQTNAAKLEDEKKAATVIIKAGTILFAVLETSVNSDEPGPIMAKVVHGTLNGARAIGEFKDIGNNQEKLTLSFTKLNIPGAPYTIKFEAVAVDPDTARTALASDVDHHYLLRYGTLFASAFVQGYANAVASSGTTTSQTQSAFGTSTISNTGNLTGKQQAYSGIGKLGDAWARATEPIFNTKPTIKIDEGIGIGLLVTSDVKEGVPALDTKQINITPENNSVAVSRSKTQTAQTGVTAAEVLSNLNAPGGK